MFTLRLMIVAFFNEEIISTRELPYGQYIFVFSNTRTTKANLNLSGYTLYLISNYYMSFFENIFSFYPFDVKVANGS